MSIEVSLKHDFGGFSLDVRFAIQRPGVTALFGPSGAGKTTIVGAIAGTFRPQSGRIVIDGRTVFDSASSIALSPRARRTGYVFQDARLFPHMSVNDNLLFGWRRSAKKASTSEIADVIALLGLERLRERRPRALSGGEKSRVALGRALLSSPDLLLLDEPLAALDAARRAEILPYLERLRDEARLPMLYVSHALDEVARLAHEIVVLSNGRVVRKGSVFEVLSDIDSAALAGDAPLGAVIETRVGARRGDGLSALAFDGGTLLVQELDRPPGTALRVRIRAEEIMLALEEPRTISANNVLLTTVGAVRRDSATHANLQLICGATRLVARITRASADRLQLAPGKPVFAIIKSVTVDTQMAPHGD
jgi:molybdate transport system ATP-binding protein